MSKVKRFMGENWPYIFSFPLLAILIWALFYSMNDGAKMRDQAEKLCYPYVMIYQNDEIIVCAGIEEPVVKKRK